VGACLLGAGSVEATDIDPLAVEAAKQNAELNGVSFRAFAGEGLGALVGRQGKQTHDVDHDESPLDQQGRRDEHPTHERLGYETHVTTSPDFAAPHPSHTTTAASYDIVLSNIISATLIRLAPDIHKIVGPGGVWIVSGIILANWPDVKLAAHSQGFELVESKEEDGWVAAAFLRF
jgi:ribosomal protein L11 methyltransferase